MLQSSEPSVSRALSVEDLRRLRQKYPDREITTQLIAQEFGPITTAVADVSHILHILWLENAYDRVESRALKHEEAYRNASTERSQLTVRVTELMGQISQLKDTIAGHLREERRLVDEKAAAHLAANTAQNAQIAADKRVEELERQVEKLQKEGSAQRADLARKQKKLDQLHAQLENRDHTSASHDAMVSQLNERIAEREEELNQVREELERVQSEAESGKAELYREIDDLNRRLAESEKKAEAKEQVIERLNSDNEATLKRCRHLETEIREEKRRRR